MKEKVMDTERLLNDQEFVAFVLDDFQQHGRKLDAPEIDQGWNLLSQELRKRSKQKLRITVWLSAAAVVFLSVNLWSRVEKPVSHLEIKGADTQTSGQELPIAAEKSDHKARVTLDRSAWSWRYLGLLQGANGSVETLWTGSSQAFPESGLDIEVNSVPSRICAVGADSEESLQAKLSVITRHWENLDGLSCLTLE